MELIYFFCLLHFNVTEINYDRQWKDIKTTNWIYSSHVNLNVPSPVYQHTHYNLILDFSLTIVIYILVGPIHWTFQCSIKTFTHDVISPHSNGNSWFKDIVILVFNIMSWNDGKPIIFQETGVTITSNENLTQTMNSVKVPTY